MSNHTHSHQWPDCTIAEAIYQLYGDPFMGNHAQIAYFQSPVVPREIALRHLYLLRSVLTQSGFLYNGFSLPNQAHQTMSLRPFLRMPHTVVENVTQSPVLQIYGREEEESSSDGTEPYINQLDQPIERNELADAELANVEDEDGYDLQTLDLELKL